MTDLCVENVSVRLGQNLVVEDVNISVAGGELVALIGPNGAGKTTLLRAVLGLLAAESGTITFGGQPVSANRQRIGYVPQRHEFAWDFPVTVAGAVMTGRTKKIGWLRRPKAADHAAVAQALERVGMADLATHPIGQLSGGQRQRVLVARALACEPAVLLLDEPLTGVDAPTQQAIGQLLTTLCADGHAVLMTTHDLVTAASACHRLVLLNRTVIADGPPDSLRDPGIWLQAFGVATSAQLLSATLGAKT